MTKDELIVNLKLLQDSDDPEDAHVQADGLLLNYINDEDVSRDFNSVPKWYA